MGHGSAILLGFSFPVFTRVHLQHHIHVNHPKNDPDHIVSTFGPIWLIAPRFFYHEVFFFQRKLWRRYELLQWGIERSIFLTIILAGLKFDFMNLIYNLWRIQKSDLNKSSRLLVKSGYKSDWENRKVEKF